ncbi:MAG: transposase [Candidatus Binatia bacterium]
MARPLRIEYDGALYHVTCRGNDRKAIFKNDSDRELFLNTLAHVTERLHWICHAYCLMNNHCHLVIETPDGNLSKGMRQLNGVYTQTFNKRHRRVGHLFQGRFKGILVQKDSHFLEVCRYVVLNPVRAKTISHPRQWKWSSYRATAGMVQPHGCLTVDEILSHFGQRKPIAQGKYSEFVQAGIDSPSIWDNLEAQSLLGAEGFAEGLRHWVTEKQQVREIPKGQRFVGRPTLAKLFSQRSRGKTSRDPLIAKAVNDYGYSQMALASFLKLHYSTISRILMATNRAKVKT